MVRRDVARCKLTHGFSHSILVSLRSRNSQFLLNTLDVHNATQANTDPLKSIASSRIVVMALIIPRCGMDVSAIFPPLSSWNPSCGRECWPYKIKFIGRALLNVFFFLFCFCFIRQHIFKSCVK